MARSDATALPGMAWPCPRLFPSFAVTAGEVARYYAIRTRDGRKARIICFDVRAKKPIAALITNDDIEEVHFYYDNGRSDQYQEYRYDLMMLPEKKEGWILLRKDGCVFDNEEVAKKNCTDDYFVAKVEWEV